MKKKNNTLLYNIIFIVICGSLLYFLLKAPPETTIHLPHNQNHERFMPMKKKEAEKFCNDCHGEKGIAPLPADHPPKYRCLFCHKRK
jgi:hypothetical protein